MPKSKSKTKTVAASKKKTKPAMLNAVRRPSAQSHTRAKRAVSKHATPAASLQYIPWHTIPLEDLNPLLQRQFVVGQEIMLARVLLKKGCVVPLHSHENEQITYILEGGLRFWIGEDEAQVIDVMAGEVLHIPSLVQHKAEALEDTLDVDIFSPPRQDWLDKTDNYLREK